MAGSEQKQGDKKSRRRADEAELLYAVLSVQLGFASADEVIAAAAAWAADRTQGLAERLEREGTITGERRELLERAVSEAVREAASNRREALSSERRTLDFPRVIRDSKPAPEQGPTRSQATTTDGLRVPSLEHVPSTGQAPATGHEGGSLGVTPSTYGRYTWRLADGRPTINAVAAELGRGGIGRVLRAFDEHLGREVAIKELLTPWSEDREGAVVDGSIVSDRIARFLREARVTGQLDHPGIPAVHEVGQREDGSLYYAMRLVKGRTLTELMKESSTLKQRLRLLPTFIDVCQAIAYAHSRGVVHRDVKPDNIMVGEYGETVLVDWGLAKVRGQRDIRSGAIEREIAILNDADVTHTMQGYAVGTPAYMSPEQAGGKVDDVDERSDVWSLGALLYELLCGRPPFLGKTQREVISQVNSQPVTPVLLVDHTVPAELAAICEKALARNKSDRYATAKELSDDVIAFRAGGEVAAYAYSNIEVLKRFIASYRVPVFVALAAVVALVVTAGIGYARVVDERDLAVSAKAQARANLTEAFVEKAQYAASRGEQAAAALYAAAALRVTETAEARGVLAGLDLGAQPQLVWQKRWRDVACDHVAFVADGHSLACSTPTAILLLDPLSGAERTRVQIQNRTARVSRDGTMAAAAVGGSTVVFFDLIRGVELGRVGSALTQLTTLEFSPSGELLLTGDDAGVVRVWTLRDRREVVTLGGHQGPITSLSVTRSGTVAAGTVVGPVRLWSLYSGLEREPHVDVSYPPDVAPPDAASSLGSTSSRDAPAAPASVEAAESTAQPQWRARLVREIPLGADALAFNEEGSRLGVAVGDRRALHVVGSRRGREQAVLAGHDDRVLSVSFASPDFEQPLTTTPLPAPSISVDVGEGLIATSSADRSVFVWSADGRERLYALRGFYDDVTSVAFAPRGGLLVATDPSVGVRAFKVPPLQPVTSAGIDQLVRAPIGTDALLAVAVSDDGETLALASADRTVRVYDRATGVLKHRFRHYPKAIRDAAAHETELTEVIVQGDVVATRTARSAQMWSIDTGRSLGVLTPGRVDGFIAVKDPSGSDGVLVWGEQAAGDDVGPVTWRLGRKDSMRPLVGPARRSSALAFSTEGKSYAFATEDAGVRVFDTETGIGRLAIPGRGLRVTRLAFAPFGHLWIAYDDRTLALVSLETGRRVRDLWGQESDVVAVAFATDGEWLATLGRDERVRIWSKGGSTPRAVLAEIPRARGLAFDAHHDGLLVSGGRGSLRRFLMEPLEGRGGDLFAEVERRFGLTLSGTRLLPRWPALHEGDADAVEVVADSLHEVQQAHGLRDPDLAVTASEHDDDAGASAGTLELP